MLTKSIPLVSVVMITYGHEKYIEEAIQGVLMQECDFEIELIVANDLSPDYTDRVVKRIIAEHPKGSCIKYTCHEHNLGMISNFNWSLNQTTGTYIAICEGDDYWTDPLKLQKQVDFLEKNPDFDLVCTNYYSDEIGNSARKEQVITMFDILKNSAIGTVTTMFTKRILDLYSKEKQDPTLSMADFQFWLFIGKKSRIYRLGDNTSYYRILQDSAMGRNSIPKQIKFALDVLSIVKQYIHLIPQKATQNSILQERYGQLFSIFIKSKDKKFIQYQWEYFKSVRRFTIIDIKILTYGLIKIYL